MNDKIKEFINNRPEVVAAYGYGSGIIKQEGYTNKDKKQLDLILVVNNLKEWHLKNMKQNKKDYSFIGSLFFKNAKEEKLKGKTNITYISNIKENNNTFKYGTIEEKDLINNLKTWNSFYTPGRFQKVVYPIKETDKIKEAIKYNRECALLLSAYLLNKDYTTRKELFNMICSLSYLGDTRMKFAENPKKVENIVNGSYDELSSIYDIKSPFFYKIDNENIKINLDYISNYITTDNNLPLYLKEYIYKNDNKSLNDNIINYITNLNKEESIKQTIKGIETNGVLRSLDYASKKLTKRFKH